MTPRNVTVFMTDKFVIPMIGETARPGESDYIISVIANLSECGSREGLATFAMKESSIGFVTNEAAAIDSMIRINPLFLEAFSRASRLTGFDMAVDDECPNCRAIAETVNLMKSGGISTPEMMKRISVAQAHFGLVSHTFTVLRSMQRGDGSLTSADISLGTRATMNREEAETFMDFIRSMDEWTISEAVKQAVFIAKNSGACSSYFCVSPFLGWDGAKESAFLFEGEHHAASVSSSIIGSPAPLQGAQFATLVLTPAVSGSLCFNWNNRRYDEETPPSDRTVETLIGNCKAPLLAGSALLDEIYRDAGIAGKLSQQKNIFCPVGVIVTDKRWVNLFDGPVLAGEVDTFCKRLLENDPERGPVMPISQMVHRAQVNRVSHYAGAFGFTHLSIEPLASYGLVASIDTDYNGGDQPAFTTHAIYTRKALKELGTVDGSAKIAEKYASKFDGRLSKDEWAEEIRAFVQKVNAIVDCGKVIDVSGESINAINGEMRKIFSRRCSQGPFAELHK